MSDKFESALLESGNIMRRGYSLLVENLGKAVAVITAAIVILLTFTDIAFPSILGKELSTQLIVMLIASYIIYFSLADAGEKLGKSTDEYITALRHHSEKRKEISGNMIGELRGFCLEYSAQELRFRQEASIMSYGYTTEEYNAYLDGKCTDKSAARVFKKISKMKPVEISPKLLLESECEGKRSELHNPEKYRSLKMFLSLIPSAVCMLFTVSMMITAKADMTLGAVIEGIVKLLTLPLIGLRGYSQGYTYAKGALSGWIECKSELLGAFLDKRSR